MMHRRRFLQLLGLAGAAAALDPALVLDPERALWVPGAKTIFLPTLPAIADGGEELYNTLLTSDWISQEALRILKKKLEFASRAYGQDPAAVGFTVNVKYPKRFGDPVVLRPGEELITITRSEP